MEILKKKSIKITLGIILWLIIFNISTKLWGIYNLVGGGYLYYSILIKNKKFKSRNKIIRVITGALVAMMTIIFGIGGLIYDEKQASATTDKQKNVFASFKSRMEVGKNKEISKEKNEEVDSKEENKTTKDANSSKVTGELKVHFIDVGQADSILIEQGSHSMLIDAGNNDDSNTVENYIATQGITNLDFLVGTHPHEDHIGGLDYIINSLQIGKIYMPKESATSKTFEDVVTATQNKGLSFTTPVPGDSFKLGDATCTILAPNNSNYEDVNNYSIVIKVEYGSTSFLLTGDAEDVSESEMLSKGYDLSATVLKVGHHGSASSTTSQFLDKVNPKYAVVSVGADNSYGHPKLSTMNRLKDKGIEVYRTDENGTIIATSDGANVTFSTKPGSYTGNGDSSTENSTGSKSTSSGSSTASTGASAGASTSASSSSSSSTGTSGGTTTPPDPSHDTSRTVYWTPNGKSYHFTDGCSTLSRSKVINQSTLGEAISKGKSDPCDKCAQ